MSAEGVIGNKGGGRKPAYIEKVRTDVLNKCWDVLLEELNDPTTPRAVKREIALKLAPRNIPQDMNVQSMGFDINIK